MTVLAVETSCDETSVALVRDGTVLSNIVASQVQLHAEYGGVVPELATREHLRNFLPIAQEAFRAARIHPRELDAVAATQGPGLPNALMVGLKAAQSVAFVLRKPFLGVHHHEAHLFSPWISGDPPAADFNAFQPNVSLIVSGGHTLLVHMQSEVSYRMLGATLDDAAGECFDKTARLMGLPYPGGPEMDRMAAEGNPAAFDFPRPLLREPGDNFSFAGLKTSVRYFLQKNPALLGEPTTRQNLCASVQAAIVEILVAKTVAAARRTAVRCITVSGGVTCNSALRRQMSGAAAQFGLNLRLAEKSLCTDNAAIIGILAERKLMRGERSSLDGEILPNWPIAHPA
jgi:N6-L-threonylcarbamoyladenine synthase